MTLVEVLAQWATRFGLTLAERRDAGEAVAALVDDGPRATFPPMHAELAKKVGVRTHRELARRVLAERLLGDELPLERARPAPVWFSPAAATAALPEAPTPPVRRRARVRCSLCNQEGHNLTTCGRPARPRARASGAPGGGATP